MTPAAAKMRTTKEVAEVLGVDVKHVRNLIAHGKLAAVDVSINQKRPDWRIAQSELDRFLATRTRAKPLVTERPRRQLPKVKKWVTV
jgi:excisionase family DNA binding protein